MYSFTLSTESQSEKGDISFYSYLHSISVTLRSLRRYSMNVIFITLLQNYRVHGFSILMNGGVYNRQKCQRHIGGVHVVHY